MAVIRRWCRCDCGKVHATAGIHMNSACSCGRQLWARAFRADAPQETPDE